jgi:hypothetical protein
VKPRHGTADRLPDRFDAHDDDLLLQRTSQVTVGQVEMTKYKWIGFISAIVSIGTGTVFSWFFARSFWGAFFASLVTGLSGLVVTLVIVQRMQRSEASR